MISESVEMGLLRVTFDKIMARLALKDTALTRLIGIY